MLWHFAAMGCVLPPTGNEVAIYLCRAHAQAADLLRAAGWWAERLGDLDLVNEGWDEQLVTGVGGELSMILSRTVLG